MPGIERDQERTGIGRAVRGAGVVARHPPIIGSLRDRVNGSGRRTTSSRMLPRVSSPARIRRTAAPSERVRVRRIPKKASYARDDVKAILDEALVAHLGFAHEGQPFVIPTLHARLGEEVYVHGSSASRTLRAVGGGGLPACLTVTILDGLVFARSVFEMSANYRSV